MDVLRFYWKVLRVAFSHSLDQAQAVIFVLLLVGGVVTYLFPQVTVNVGGVEVAAFVFGGIIAIRLLLAPYWVWKKERDKATAAVSSKSAKRVVLEKFYVESGPLLQAAHPGNIKSEDDLRAFIPRADVWLNETANWLRENMGEASAARFLDFSGGAAVLYTGVVNQQHNAVIQNLTRARKNLLAMIDTSAL
jgi:hypothetical protein